MKDNLILQNATKVKNRILLQFTIVDSNYNSKVLHCNTEIKLKDNESFNLSDFSYGDLNDTLVLTNRKLKEEIDKLIYKYAKSPYLINKLTWNDIFDCDKTHKGEIETAKELAKQTGYSWFCFKDQIYTLYPEDKNDKIGFTGLYRKDIK